MPPSPPLHLVRGAGGFLGGQIAHRLLARGCRVRLFTRHADRLALELRGHSNAEVVEADARDRGRVVASLRGVDRVFDFVGGTVPATSAGMLLELELNLEPLALLLESMVQVGGCRIVFPSSGGTIYGQGGGRPLPESAPLLPESPYGAGKLLAEEMIRFYARLHGLRYLILRIANPYGRRSPGVASQGVIDVFLQRAIERQPIDVWGDGAQVRDYLHVEDLNDAVEALLRSEVEDETINVGSGEGHTLSEIIELIGRITGRSLERRQRGDVYSGILHNVLDVEKIRRRTGWAPRISLASGIEDLWRRLQEEERGGAVPPQR